MLVVYWSRYSNQIATLWYPIRVILSVLSECAHIYFVAIFCLCFEICAYARRSFLVYDFNFSILSAGRMSGRWFRYAVHSWMNDNERMWCANDLKCDANAPECSCFNIPTFLSHKWAAKWITLISSYINAIAGAFQRDSFFWFQFFFFHFQRKELKTVSVR